MVAPRHRTAGRRAARVVRCARRPRRRVPPGTSPSACHRCPAGIGRDREPGRHGDTERGHLREPDTLATEELSPSVGVLVERVDVPHAKIEAQPRRPLLAVPTFTELPQSPGARPAQLFVATTNPRDVRVAVVALLVVAVAAIGGTESQRRHERDRRSRQPPRRARRSRSPSRSRHGSSRTRSPGRPCRVARRSGSSYTTSATSRTTS